MAQCLNCVSKIHFYHLLSPVLREAEMTYTHALNEGLCVNMLPPLLSLEHFKAWTLACIVYFCKIRYSSMHNVNSIFAVLVHLFELILWINIFILEINISKPIGRK